MIEQLGPETKAQRSRASTASGDGLTHYELLDVSPQATRLQIREAYIRLKNTYASGSQALYSLVSDDEARQTLDKMEEAYRVLDDDLQRKEYDESLGLVKESQNQNHNQRASLGASDPFASHTPQPEPKRTRPAAPEREEPSTYRNDASTWADEVPDTRPLSRRVSAFTKIKKFAARAFDKEVKAQEEDLLGKPGSFDGVILTQLRELMSVPQSEVQERTKIAIEYIKALENNDFQKLPSLVYVRGFLKIYLQYLGLQDDEARPLLEAYAEKYNNWREKHRPHSS